MMLIIILVRLPVAREDHYMSALSRHSTQCIFLLKQTTEAPRLTLNDGGSMPVVGLGTYLGWNHNPEDEERLVTAVEYAIDIGYRHIDTATIYKNEHLVGRAIQNKISDGTVKREDLFITTKLWNDDHRPELVEKAFNASLERLGLEYLDLYLMHWPMGYHSNGSEDSVDYLDTWTAMEELLRKSLVKSIGVSNFNIRQLTKLLKKSSIKPSVLQVEVHLSLTQEPLVEFAQKNGLVVTAYCPLGYLPSIRRGDVLPAPGLTNPTLNSIADKYKKSVTQIALKYLVQRGMAVIPKSLTSLRISKNADLFDFDLTTDEVNSLGQYNSNSRIVLPDFWQDHLHYPFEKSGKPTPNVFLTEN